MYSCELCPIQSDGAKVLEPTSDSSSVGTQDVFMAEAVRAARKVVNSGLGEFNMRC